jgi:hypothetical protein
LGRRLTSLDVETWVLILELVEERRFGNGVIVLRYAVRG